MNRPLLSVEKVSRHFGGVQALTEVTLSVAAGERVALIGPNGAGKSTLVNCIAGSTGLSGGEVRFDGHRISGLSAQARARRGISRTFQNLELFATMTVLENVLLAIEAGSGATTWLHPGRASARRERAMEALTTLGIAGYADQTAGALPYGVRKLVELSRAFVTRPKLLLLDEPVAGLSDTEEFLEILHQCLDLLGCGVLLIEHDMPTVRRLCGRVHVLDSGRLIASGTYDDVARDPRVMEAYLGTSASDDGRGGPAADQRSHGDLGPTTHESTVGPAHTSEGATP